MKKTYTVLWLLFLALFLTQNSFSQLPQYYNFNTNGENNSFPFNQAAGKMVQYLFLANDFNTPTPATSGLITKFWFRIADTYPLNQTYTSIYIRMGQTALTAFAPGSFYAGTMDTVWSKTNFTINAGGGTWYAVNLDNPFPYNPAQSLVVEIGQCGASSTTGFSVCNSIVAAMRRNWSVSGCPFVYSSQNARIMNAGINVVPTTPAYFNFNTTSGTNNFPFNMPAGKMCQWLYAPGDLNQPSNAPSGNITSVYFFMAGAGATNRIFTEFTIRMGRTALTSLPTGSFHTGPMDTVYHRATVSLSSSTAAWMLIPLDVPYMYRNDSSLVVEVGQCSFTPTSGAMWICQTSRTGFRRNYSVGGCPFAWIGQDATQGHFGIYIPNPLGVSNNNNNEIPKAFRLDQNYPNPFNPVTTISFGLPKSSNVKLTIYDMLGREVEVLVNEVLTPGNHSIDFDAYNLASGTYLYKLEAGSFVETKKMMLIK